MSRIQINEIEREGRLMLATRADSSEIAEAVASLNGLALTSTTGSSSIGEISALCLAPQRWLLLMDKTRVHDFAEQLGSSLSQTVSHVADVTASRVGFSISGAGACDLISSMCPLNLDPSVFAPGQCAQSLLARVPVCLFRPSERPDYRLYVDRSFSAYARAWLTDAQDQARVGE